MAFCQLCNAKLIALDSQNSTDVSFSTAPNCHICTYYICSNSNCEELYLKEQDFLSNSLSLKPLDSYFID